MKNKVEIFIICSRIFTVIVAIAENRKKKEFNERAKFADEVRVSGEREFFGRNISEANGWSLLMVREMK